jgi:hypothetical protein
MIDPHTLRRQELNQLDLGAGAAGIAHSGASSRPRIPPAAVFLNVPRRSEREENNLWALALCLCDRRLGGVPLLKSQNSDDRQGDRLRA